MIYDLTRPLTDFFGEPICDKETPDGYTLGIALLRAALFVNPLEPLPPAEVKMRRFELGRKIYNSLGIAISLSVEEVADLRKQVGAMYMPLLMGMVWSILDSADETT
jgi:hypothetical protein